MSPRSVRRLLTLVGSPAFVLKLTLYSLRDPKSLPCGKSSAAPPPVCWHRDGTPFYTLPIIHDPSTGKMVGDSFEITAPPSTSTRAAVYPNGPHLIPPSTTALHEHPAGTISPFAARGTARTKQLAEVKEAPGVLVRFYFDEDAPFLEGALMISYADIIVEA
ncbi:hypothetical protein B0H16DRAFT_1454945 [Mycena metata]|uniref:Uncharacterized protein n=1 Tax=Mycena metata TaxID=1033252 RepID=A0AAD7NKA2_9AGAR|nr:hypothetical protein B0H16DRAFT_1454945 [Mycena metata]